MGIKDAIPFYQNLFEEERNRVLLKMTYLTVMSSLKVKEASFEAIVKELQTYNLSRTTDDVKGIAFEKF